MAIKLISAISTKEHIQFQNSSGTNTGKIESVGDNLVITNAVGDVLFGDTDSDIYIGDGVNSIDIIFEQSGAIRAETGSSVTLALGSSDTTLNVYNPQIANGMTLTSTMTMGTGSAIDFLPDTGVFLKFDGQTILERKTANGAITLGHDDSIIIAGGDMSNSMNTNINNAEETVFIGAEGGVKLYGFPNNDAGGWSARSQFLFSNDGKMYFGTAVDTNLYRSAANTLKTDDSFLVGGDFIKEGGGGIFKLYVPSWTSGNQNHDVLYNAWNSSLGDYVYLKASGNSTGGHGAAIIGDEGFYVGRTNSESGAMVDSATAPLDSDVWFYATPSKFVVNDNLEVDGDISIGGGETADDARLHFRASDDSNRFTIETDLDANTDNILVLKGNGNVGIGTASPDFKLDVAGDIGINGNIYHNGDHNTYVGFSSDTLTFRTGGTDRLTLTNTSATFAGTISASNLSGTNTGDQTLPTLSSLGALSASGTAFSLSGTDVTVGESITLAGGLSYSGTTLTSANDNTTYTASTGLTLTGTAFSVTANTYAAASHNHTSLTGITSLSFAAQSSDAASITTTISGTGTYFDFNLTDDNNNDWWRWRFTPTGSTVYDAMVLKPISNGNANLIVSGNVTADNLSGSNTGDQTLPTLSSLGAAPLASPGLTGTPTAPTAGATVNTTQLATTAFVQTAVSNLVDSSPGALNTLNELAAALGDDASFSTTVTTSIATKLPLAGGAMTGDIDMAAGTGITFYGNGSGDHGIFGRNSAGTASDDIRINSYHNVHINLDSNSNNTSGTTFFTIGEHGGTGTLGSNVFTVDGSGNVVASGTMGASNLSGTNTGDQTLPTLSSLGALSTSGGTMTGSLIVPKISIGTTSTSAPLNIAPATDYKVIKLADDVTSHYKITGLANHTLALTCGSYYQAEVVITANQTNGGANNNLYLRGIWSNNHTSHNWDILEEIGGLTTSSFSITNSQNGSTAASGKLEIVHEYSSGSFAQMIVRVTDLYGTHSYTIS